VSVFASIAVPAELRAAVSEEAWLDAMLAAERALANAGSRAGLFPADVAAAIAAQCRAELYDWDEIAKRGRAVGNRRSRWSVCSVRQSAATRRSTSTTAPRARTSSTPPRCSSCATR
jgi:hypothetical protein